MSPAQRRTFLYGLAAGSGESWTKDKTAEYLQDRLLTLSLKGNPEQYTAYKEAIDECLTQWRDGLSTEDGIRVMYDHAAAQSTLWNAKRRDAEGAVRQLSEAKNRIQETDRMIAENKAQLVQLREQLLDAERELAGATALKTAWENHSKTIAELKQRIEENKGQDGPPNVSDLTTKIGELKAKIDEQPFDTSRWSQGTLQSIYEFQTLICQLTGMEVSNASLYDGATALAEAALMASSITGRTEWVVSDCVSPSCRETLRTYAWASGHTLIEQGRSGITTDFDKLSSLVSDKTACVIVQNPNFFGALESMADAEQLAHANGAMFVVSYDPISLGLLKTPGDYGADIAVAEGQSLGIPQSFCGPLVGLFSCKQQYVRQMPGRIVGATTDTQGRRGYVLTLQTREQHIRREKATSNICSNQALCALAATVYLTTLGKNGLREVAELCVQKSHYLADELTKLAGYQLLPSPTGDKGGASFLKEFVVKCPRPAAEINARLREKGLIGGLYLGKFYPDLSDHMLLCVTEKRTKREMDALLEVLAR
jgi:glycine dehydrogenase subunit 1